MSHITEFSIQGLAGRESVFECKLNRDLNIFYGLNGCGKTSLLKILHSAMAGDASILAAVPFKSAEVKIYSQESKRVYTYRIKAPRTPDKSSMEASIRRREEEMSIFSGEIMEDKRAMSSYRWMGNRKLKIHRWHHQYLPTSRLYLVDEALPIHLSSSGSVYESEEQLEKFFARSMTYLWRGYSSQVLGLVRKAQEKGLAQILRTILAKKHTREKSDGSLTTPSITFARVATFLKRHGSPKVLGSEAQFLKRYKMRQI